MQILSRNRLYGISSWALLLFIVSPGFFNGARGQGSGAEQVLDFLLNSWIQLTILFAWPTLTIAYGVLIEKIHPHQGPDGGRVREALKLTAGFLFYFPAFALLIIPQLVLDKLEDGATLNQTTASLLVAFSIPLINYLFLALYSIGKELWWLSKGPPGEIDLKNFPDPSLAYFSLHVLNIFVICDIVNFGTNTGSIPLLISTLMFFGPIAAISLTFIHLARNQAFDDPDTLNFQQFNITLRLFISIASIVFLFTIFSFIRYGTEYHDLSEHIEYVGLWFIGVSSFCLAGLSVSLIWSLVSSRLN